MRMHQEQIRLSGTSRLDEVGVKRLCSRCLGIHSNDLKLAQSHGVFEPNGMQETHRSSKMLEEGVAVLPV